MSPVIAMFMVSSQLMYVNSSCSVADVNVCVVVADVPWLLKTVAGSPLNVSGYDGDASGNVKYVNEGVLPNAIFTLKSLVNLVANLCKSNDTYWSILQYVIVPQTSNAIAVDSNIVIVLIEVSFHP